MAYKNKKAPGLTVPYKPLPAEPVQSPEPSPEPEQKSEPATKADTVTETVTAEKQEKTEPQQATASQGRNQNQDAPAEAATQPVPTTAPIFKVQLLVSSSKLKPGSAHFKGVTDVDYYEEGRLFKYTSGASANYQTIYNLRKELLARFPEAFIVAFKDGVKVNVNEAIREYKANKKKK